MKQDLKDEMSGGDSVAEAPPEFDQATEQAIAIIQVNTALIKEIENLMRTVPAEDPQRSLQLNLLGGLVAQLTTQADQMRFQNVAMRLSRLIKGSLAEFLEQTAAVIEASLDTEIRGAEDDAEFAPEETGFYTGSL